MVCPPATSEAGARPLEGQLSLQINECLGAISFDKAVIRGGDFLVRGAPLSVSYAHVWYDHKTTNCFKKMLINDEQFLTTPLKIGKA
jgi:hypothetical protein